MFVDTQNLKITGKNCGIEIFLGKTGSCLCMYPLSHNNFAEIAPKFWKKRDCDGHFMFLSVSLKRACASTDNFFLSPDFHQLLHSVMSICLLTDVKRQQAMLVLGWVTV